MIYILFLGLLILLLIFYHINNKEIISPSCIFSFSFLFSSFWAILYVSEWGLEDFHLNTFLVILGGVLIFGITCNIIKKIEKNKKNQDGQETFQTKYININVKFKALILIICVVTVLLTVFELLNKTGLNIENLLEAISIIKKETTFSNEEIIEFSTLLKAMRIFVTSATYFFIYVITNNYIISKKIDYYLLTIILLGEITFLEVGSRTGLFNTIVFAIISYFLIYKKKNGINKKMNLKTIFCIGIIGIIFLMSFQLLLFATGRGTKLINTFDYLAYYSGAEIKNLDTFLQEELDRKSNYFGSQTFINVYRFLSKRLKDKNLYYSLDLPFREINGKNLGNVYTTFYPYIYDFGYIGAIFLIIIMALISQLFYEKAKKSKNQITSLICSLIYLYICTALALSFFSNKFYEQLFNSGFIYMIIVWLVLILICNFNVFKKIRDDKNE